MRSFARKAIAAAAGIALGILSSEAQAESLEIALGLTGGVLMPSFESTDRTSFALATWTTGVTARTGLTDDLDLELRVAMAMFRGATNTTLPYRGQSLDGRLHFAALSIHPELGARYNLVGGYALSPYVEAGLGFLWTRYTDQHLLDRQDRDFGLGIPNVGQGALTARVGASLEYRLLDLLLLGLRGGWARSLSRARYRQHFTLTLEAGFAWFP